MNKAMKKQPVEVDRLRAAAALEMRQERGEPVVVDVVVAEQDTIETRSVLVASHAHLHMSRAV